MSGFTDIAPALTGQSIDQLERSDGFIRRHIGPGETDIEGMLAEVGAGSLAALIDDTVPAGIRRRQPMPLPGPMSEEQALTRLQTIAAGNQVLRACIGMGYHDTFTPPVILRNVLENPAWYTAYTPYQPEVSQGRLEGLLNFQQMVMDLTAMELANASLLDEGTAAAEAMTLVKRVNRDSRSLRFFVDANCHPQTIAVVRTRAEHMGFDIVVGDPARELADADVFGVLLQYPGSDGDIPDLGALVAQAHAGKALAVVAADLLSLVLLTPPGSLGADVVVGSSQRFGVPMGGGGPHAAFLATRDAFKRSVPGRIIGVSVDRHGDTALRMAMQTREQHIRREKATSNICTSQALLALCAAFYAMYHGPEGLSRIAARVHRLARILDAGLTQLGYTRCNARFFDTLTLDPLTLDNTSPDGTARQRELLAAAEAAGYNLRGFANGHIGISLDETTTSDDVQALLDVFAGTGAAPAVAALDAGLDEIPGFGIALARREPFLQHPIFNRYHSETAMLRYLQRLASRDIALNQSMIALGSCTMKLNATAEMMPISWPAFARIHPFAPASQTAGYRQLFGELEQMLVATTGYHAASLQPNAGSQGEYAGLIAIKRYHQARGQGHRDVCLIPGSAHGTNPASAVMAGMQVVIVNCDDQGNVDLDDLGRKIGQHRERLAAIMVTYPSTHGVFEEGIVEICRRVHDAGGQVYVDGANLNALVGIAALGEIGADVSHINLHKTFCIPHGGGGPGMGPIAVAEHLTPYLPGHPVVATDGKGGAEDTISAAPWGSALILPISWMYIRMMGAEGLTRATEVAILSANYVARRLAPHFPVLYTGRNGRVAHECIIDLRPLKEATGITEEDVAKRLIDYGFHAPTMSFPVPGTLMIEPTESEDRAELDRFCDALIRIGEEIRQVQAGGLDALDNPLKNAPHTAAEAVAEHWGHPYPRELAAFPAPEQRHAKYWPPVGRIDNVYGDRNLFCACPGIENYV